MTPPARDDKPSIADLELTPKQLELARLPYDSRQVVLAGAGTGKTRLVVARLGHLVCFQNLKPRSQVLLLSYTRSAVREMRERLGKTAKVLEAATLTTADVRTMDSFAYGLHEIAEIPAPTGDYEEAMRSACALVKSSAVVRKAVGSYRHVLVDEAQDLNGPRQEFIRSVLSVAGGGFTVFADPNQAIYDYLLFEDALPVKEGFESLLKWLHGEMHARTDRLQGSHRHVGRVLGLVTRAEGHLNDRSIDWSQKWDRVVADLRTFRKVPPASLGEHLRSLSGRTAILTRTNGQALSLSRDLFELDPPVQHTLVGAPSSFPLPGWIGRLLPDLPSRFGPAEVKDAWISRIGKSSDEDRSVVEAHRTLALIAGSSGEEKISLEEVVESMQKTYQIPAEVLMDARPEKRIMVSTVHRAKGREFDNVLFVDPAAPREGSGSGLPMEVRVLYVALSRPRENLALVKVVDGSTTVAVDSATDRRWYIRSWNPKLPANIEVRPADLNPYSVIPEAAAGEVQDRIWSLGTSSELRATLNPYWGGRWSLWQMRAGKEREYLAGLTDHFDRSVQAVQQVNWNDPRSSAAVWYVGLEAVATFAGRPPAGLQEQVDGAILERGYWLVPILRGWAAMWAGGRG